MSKKVRLGLELEGNDAEKFEQYLNGPKTLTPFMKECVDDVATYCYPVKE